GPFMRFALLGDHRDGLEMARALAASGRHQLSAYSGPSVGAEYLQRWGLEPRRVGDLEEVLADPGIDAVVVAGRPALRPGQLRRRKPSRAFHWSGLLLAKTSLLHACRTRPWRLAWWRSSAGPRKKYSWRRTKRGTGLAFQGGTPCVSWEGRSGKSSRCADRR